MQLIVTLINVISLFFKVLNYSIIFVLIQNYCADHSFYLILIFAGSAHPKVLLPKAMVSTSLLLSTVLKFLQTSGFKLYSVFDNKNPQTDPFHISHIVRTKQIYPTEFGTKCRNKTSVRV